MSEIKYLSDLRLVGGASIAALRAENLATVDAPVAPHAGQIYFDITDSVLKFWDGAAWSSIANDQDFADAIAALEGRMDSAEGRLDSAEGRLDAAEGAIVTAESHATDAQTRVGVLEGQNLDARLTQAEADVITAESHATDAQTRVGTLEPQVAQALVDIVTAQGAADAAQADASDAQSRVAVLEGQGLDTRLSAVETANSDDDALIAAAQAAADAAQLDASDAQGRVAVLEPEVAQALLDIVTAQGTADLAETHAADAQTRVGAIEAENLPSRVATLEDHDIDHEGRIDALEMLNIGAELTGLDGRLDTLEGQNLDSRITAIETAPYATEGYVNDAVAPKANEVASQLVSRAPVTTALSDVYATVEYEGQTFSLMGIPVASFGFAANESIEFANEVDGSWGVFVRLTDGDVTFDEALFPASGTSLSITQAMAAAELDFAGNPGAMVQFKTLGSTPNTSVAGIMASFNNDVVRGVEKSTIYDAMLTISENMSTGLSTKADKYAETITGNGTDAEFDLPVVSGDRYAVVTVWDVATGSAVFVDVTRAYRSGTGETTFHLSFAEAPAGGKEYRVALALV